MADEIKQDEVQTNPKTEAKDFDFEAFLAEIGKENPDMSIVKAGIEKFGSGKLSDAQKEQFLQTVFPNSENNHLTNNSQKLGFENISGIKNTLSALKDLQQEGVLDAEQINNVMSVKYPQENGKNMAMALALNVRAAEFKWKKLSDPNDVAIVKHNLQSYSETLALMGQIEPKALENALKEPYQPAGMDRKLTINDLAAKSEILSEFIDKPSGYQAAQSENAVTIDGEGKTVVGGDNNGLTVDGQQKPAIKVNTKTPEQEEDAENIANMSPNTGDDKKKRKPFEFEKVKEQDIIQYMFEHWFLEGVSLALKAPFWLADKLIDAYEGKFDTNMPKTPSNPNQLAKNVPAIKFLNNTGGKLAQNVKDSLNDQVDYYDRLYNTIQQNAGKPVNKWYIDTVERYSQVPVLDINNPLDVKKINEFNKMYAQNPTAFARKFEATQSQLSHELTNFTAAARVAGSIATAVYMAENPEGPFGPNAEEAIQKNMTGYMQKFSEISRTIMERTEAEYRIQNGIDLDAKLDSNQARDVLTAHEKKFGKFMEDLAKNTKNLRNNLNTYYNSKTASEQEINIQQIKASREGVDKVLSPDYLDTLTPKREDLKEKPVEKTLLDFTKDFNAAETREAAIKEALTGDRKIFESLHAENEGIKVKFNERPIVKKFKDKTEKVMDDIGNFFRKSTKEK